jgi:hypothetical protein
MLNNISGSLALPDSEVQEIMSKIYPGSWLVFQVHHNGR